MNPWLDEQYEDSVVAEVCEMKTGYDIKREDGWSCWLGKEHHVVPRVGQRLRAWGRGIGHPFRGLAFDDAVAFYKTEAEQQADFDAERRRWRGQQQEEYENERRTWDARVTALQPPLRLRMERFRAVGGDDWRWHAEPYEMASVEEASRLIARFESAEALRSFGKLDHEAQKAIHPNMGEGHSGNTWNHALRLAILCYERPDLVPRDHAVICALVGCEEARCWAANKGRVTV